MTRRRTNAWDPRKTDRTGRVRLMLGLPPSTAAALDAACGDQAAASFVQALVTDRGLPSKVGEE